MSEKDSKKAGEPPKASALVFGHHVQDIPQPVLSSCWEEQQSKLGKAAYPGFTLELLLFGRANVIKSSWKPHLCLSPCLSLLWLLNYCCNFCIWTTLIQIHVEKPSDISKQEYILTHLIALWITHLAHFPSCCFRAECWALAPLEFLCISSILLREFQWLYYWEGCKSAKLSIFVMLGKCALRDVSLRQSVSNKPLKDNTCRCDINGIYLESHHQATWHFLVQPIEKRNSYVYAYDGYSQWASKMALGMKHQSC